MLGYCQSNPCSERCFSNPCSETTSYDSSPVTSESGNNQYIDPSQYAGVVPSASQFGSFSSPQIYSSPMGSSQYASPGTTVNVPYLNQFVGSMGGFQGGPSNSYGSFPSAMQYGAMQLPSMPYPPSNGFGSPANPSTQYGSYPPQYGIQNTLYTVVPSYGPSSMNSFSQIRKKR